MESIWRLETNFLVIIINFNSPEPYPYQTTYPQMIKTKNLIIAVNVWLLTEMDIGKIQIVVLIVEQLYAKKNVEILNREE